MMIGIALHLLLQILVGRGDHPHVHPDGAVRADRANLAILQHPQQLHLQRRAHLPDLVEEDGAAVRQLKHARTRADRAGEGAALVPEDLGFQQLGRDRTAVDWNERLVSSRRECVDRARHQLLAGAALAHDQDRGVGRRDLLDKDLDFLDQRMLAYDERETFHVRVLQGSWGCEKGNSALSAEQDKIFGEPQRTSCRTR
jgi:hypothetical protein